MRAAFGTMYGISLTLAPDYWYLRGFDPKAMESSVDFFGFMSYDLHGSWDADVKTLGSLVRPQTDIREIANDSVPLFFDNLDPAKINIGLAFYGRGYTLASSSCAYFGCPFIGPSNPMPCTAFAGVASNTEIKSIIAQKGLQPELIPDAMVKQITWDDQWIGYDDDDTFALKLSWADSHCFGGTMIWSIDMDSGSGSGNTPDGGATGDSDPGGNGGEGSDAGATEGGQENGGSPNGGPTSSDGSAGSKNETVPYIYIDPSIWTQQNPVVMCNPPCQLILPPFPFQGGVTITPGSLTTTIDVENNMAYTTVISGVEQVHNQIVESILTTTISVAPFTATQMGFYGLNVTGTKATSALITPTASIDIPVFSLTETVTRDQGGSSTSSSPILVYITPPPYPWTTGGSDKPPSPGPPPPGPPPTLPHIPVITFKPGSPGPICKSGCGTPCLVFCPSCGFFGCGGCGLFGCGNDNSVIESGDTDNTNGNEPDGDEGGEDEDEQDEDEDECLLEIGGGQGDGNSANGPAITSFTNSNPPKPSSQSIPPPPPQVSIASAPPPPKPSPPPPSEPPLPNPDTETLKCYKKGSFIGRGTAIALLNDFCGPKYWGGTTISENRYIR